MNPKLIVIDGKTYKSVEEMPEDVRRNYESAMSQLADNDRNGIPDALENFTNLTGQNKNGMPDAFEGMVSNIISSTKIIAAGNEYNSLDELPPEARAKYEQAMDALDTNRNGMPDFFEGRMNAPVQMNDVQNNPAMSTPPTPRHSTAIPASPNIEPEATNKWMLALFAIALFGICLAGAFAAWYFFLR
ncbi:MAG TPA: hypothetical protein VNA23_10635 [Anaerolineales bacterium]|nr:hypothetical protein [Anaerolineales bacterium]